MKQNTAKGQSHKDHLQGQTIRKKCFSVSSHGDQGRTKQVQVNPRPLQSRTVGKSPKDLRLSKTPELWFCRQANIKPSQNKKLSGFNFVRVMQKHRCCQTFQGSTWGGDKQKTQLHQPTRSSTFPLAMKLPEHTESCFFLEYSVRALQKEQR